ncbi:MAG: SMI1/KNR4 family protein [Myxococcales bacterium]|nr:SMI1/KNR4 family protein [Myxococcales bacterium]
MARPLAAATRAATTPPPRPPTARPAPAAPLRAAPVTAPPAPLVDHHARIAELWRRLEAWVAMTGAPPLALAPGAPEKAIAAAEKAMKLAFPPDFRASLAIHDGQIAGDGGPPFPWMAGCGPLLPLAEVVARWREEQDLAARKAPRKDVVAPTDKLRAGVHRAGRVPIARTAGRDPELAFLDLDPGPAGTRGQLATMVSRAELVVIDTGFAPALERWVNVLERGLWSYDRERHVAHPRALAPATSHPAGLFSRR